MGTTKISKQLSKLLQYILGRSPEEFGLIPDEDGWVLLKDLLQALSEEDGWRHVRQAALNEILLSDPSPPFEIQDKRIRTVDRSHLKQRTPAANLPKLLYIGITRKSYPVVLEKGIIPTRHPYIILSSEQLMAERIAKRRDPEPILLTVNSTQAATLGILFFQISDTLFITDMIPIGCFSGPPLPKQKDPPAKKHDAENLEKKQLAGSFIMQMPQDPFKKDRKKPAAGSWKRDKKRIRREKQKQWPD